jgi:hypothetical protein
MKINKELKKLGLIAGKKKTEQLIKVSIAMWLVLGFIIIINLVR